MGIASLMIFAPVWVSLRAWALFCTFPLQRDLANSHFQVTLAARLGHVGPILGHVGKDLGHVGQIIGRLGVQKGRDWRRHGHKVW